MAADRLGSCSSPGSPQGTLVVKNLPANAGDKRHAGSIPGSGRSPGEGNGYPLQYSCLENSIDRGAWWATGHAATKSQTGLRTSTFLGSGAKSSVDVAHGLNCPTLCGIFPDEGLNPYPLYWQADSYPLPHQGSLLFEYFNIYIVSLL